MYNTQVYKNKHKDSAMEDSILTFHVNDIELQKEETLAREAAPFTCTNNMSTIGRRMVCSLAWISSTTMREKSAPLVRCYRAPPIG